MRTPVRWLLLAVLAAGCGVGGSPTPGRTGSRYGGVFNFNETEPLRSIFPLTLTQAASFRIMAQVYQGLVTFDRHDLSIKPCLAERWEVNATATEYTFHLRKGVRFHNDPAFPEGKGRELVAADVVHCFNAICTNGIGDQVMWLFQDRVEGANAHYAATAHAPPPPGGVKGISALDERTVRIRLTQPTPNFLQIVAHQGCWIWPKELVTTYGPSPADHAIGTGPFVMHPLAPGEAMVLERNPEYWDLTDEGSPLPYLDAVRVTFEEDKNAETEAFLNGRLSAMVELPLQRLEDLRDTVGPDGKLRFRLLRMPALSTQFYSFDIHRPPFNDERVRKAISWAIDQRYLVDSVLGGMATPAEHGIVAPGLIDYPYARVPGCGHDPARARALLAEAGYPDGRGFPPVQLQANADGFGYVQVAEAVQEMLQRELNISISISMVRADEHYDRVEHGRVRFWREGWTADHPDPENFLALFYGRNAVRDTALPASINMTRFHDAAFDGRFALAQRTINAAERYGLLAAADSVMMARMPIVPLYHENAAYLVQPRVRDLALNPIEFLDLSRVWIEDEAGDPAQAAQ